MFRLAKLLSTRIISGKGIRLLSTEAKSLTPQTGSNQVPRTNQYYKDGQLVARTSIVLKKEEGYKLASMKWFLLFLDITSYVLSIIKDYYRTTNKNQLNLESSLADHGLDSLDSIELSMQIEEDLG